MTQSSFSYERYVEPQRTPEGFVLTPFNTTALVWTSFIFALILLPLWCVASFFIFGVKLLLFLLFPSLSFSGLLSLLFSSLLPLSGIIGIVWIVRRMKRIERLNVSAEAISPIYPLLLGESCTVQFRCQRHDMSTAHPGNIAAKWLCYEWVEYGVGTDIENSTHMLWETDLPGASISPGTTRVEYDAPIYVLAQGLPSIDAAHNQVRWELQVTVDTPGTPPKISKFRFKVVPEISR